VPEFLLVPAGDTDHEHVGFVQDEIRLRSDLQFTAGVKVENNNYSGWDFDPSGRIIWSPGINQALWGAITRAVTTPSDLEENFHLQASTPGLVYQVLGNRNFKSEQVTGYELGYRRMVAKRFLIDLAAYRNEYSRLQSFSVPAFSTSGGVTFVNIEYTNQIAGSDSGIELATEAQIEPWWHLDANYSFLNSDFTASGATSDISSTGSVHTYEGSSPKHMVTLQSMFNLPAHFHFDQMYRYVSALPAQMVPAYQTMDAHFQKDLGHDFAVELVGQNLFQNFHSEWGTGNPDQVPEGIYRAGYVRLVFQPGP
jgi:iron complex outermembrane receptor protein